MQRNRVLIVDDESDMREFLAQILSEHFRVSFAKNADEAIERAQADKPSIVILDILMAGESGIDVCQLMRTREETQNLPIVMLTALNSPEQRILAFEAGADDYLAKPFLPEELLARINSKLIRQSRQQVSDATFSRRDRFGNLKLQFEDLSLEVDGVSHELGQVEFKILNFLLKRVGELVPRQELNDHVWGDQLPSERALDPHITSLRKKLHNSDGELKTVYGKGYSVILKKLES